MYKYNIEKRHNNNNNNKNMFILTCYVIIINVHNVLSASASSSPLLNNVIRIDNLENNIISIRAPEAKIGGADDVIINLENNKPVKILLRSVDVLHNWYVPQFRSKMDAVPGIVTFYWFEPNKVGEYEVLCAEYCGVGHYAMRGGGEVQSTEDYNIWLSEQETFNDLIAKQEIEFENKKVVKNNNLILNKEIYKEE